MKNYFMVFCVLLFLACTKTSKTSKEHSSDDVKLPILNLNQAQRLVNLPMHLC